jgi:endo-alpha-1,4-polygalactosaminidase (GH114 family)
MPIRKLFRPKALLFLTLLLQSGVGSAQQATTTMRPDKVRSWVYSIPFGPNSPNFSATVASSPFDLVILGGGLPAKIDRTQADPGNNKLLIGYISTCEAASYAEPELFANGTKAAILGRPVPGYTDLYTVQYWDPAWQSQIFKQVDNWIAAGADGVFLDELTDHAYWTPGNTLGNTAYADAPTALVSFVQAIRGHIASQKLARPFYVIGNNPGNLAQTNPSVLASLDLVTNEWLYWGQPATNGLDSVYQGTANASWIQSSLSKIYANSLVLGNDYPKPLSNYAADWNSFIFYASLGWLPSVTNAFQDERVFTSGPFMFMARPNNATVTGVKNKVNFLSGGIAINATLTGGDMGDYFLGGPGQNTITAGAGDDTIYAHPPSATLKGQFSLQVVSGAVNATVTPKVQVLVNGRAATPITPVTQNYADPNYVLQTINVDANGQGPITSIEIDGLDIYYGSSTNFSNVFVLSLSYCGIALDLSKGNVASNAGYLADSASVLLNQGGKLSFSAATLPTCSYPANTSSSIDGGGGSNTVVYRANYSNYTVLAQADGSWLVTSKATAEGPDTLRNIQTLKFADVQVPLASKLSPTPACLFAFAQASFPSLFGGTPVQGTMQQYSFAYYPASGNFLAMDQSSGIWVLGPYTGNNLLFVGVAAQFSPAVNAWAASHGGCG